MAIIAASAPAVGKKSDYGFYSEMMKSNSEEAKKFQKENKIGSYKEYRNHFNQKKSGKE